MKRFLPVFGITSAHHNLNDNLIRAGLWNWTIHKLDRRTLGYNCFFHSAHFLPLI